MSINIGSNVTLSLKVSNTLIVGGTADVLTLNGTNDTVNFLTGDILKITGISNDDTVNIGSRGTVFLQGSIGTEDFITGTSGADVFFGGAGDDSFTGIASDEVDYSSISQAITLDALGVVKKGTLGIDTLRNIGTIIGKAGLDNVIDATLPPGTPGTTSVTVDLATDSLVVNNIPTIGALSFKVENFSTVIGTTGNDTITANSGTDVFFGSAGDDLYNGSTAATASDTVNYSLINQAITLESLGLVVKGTLGIDTLRNIGTIIGKAGLDNVINATLPPGTPGTTSVTVDLATDSLKVNNIPTIGALSFKVENFSTVIGTTGNDTITANSGTDVFFGSAGNDDYNGSTAATASDTVNYNSISQAITLESLGLVKKGTLGTDTLRNIGTIIGKTGLDNVIDATLPPGTPGTTNVTVDLATDSLVVNNIPTIGALSFTVENFSTVIGTTGNDKITANSGKDVFFGSAGNDIYNGSTAATASDTVNYSLIGQAVTLVAPDLVRKGGGLGTDTITDIGTLVGTIVVSGFGTVEGTVLLGTDGSVNVGSGSTVILSPNAGTTASTGGTQPSNNGTPDVNTISLTSGSISVYTGPGVDTIQFAGSGNTLINQGGTDSVTDTGSNNTFVLPPAGTGQDIITGNVLANGDIFDLTQALAATTWDGQQSDIGNYIQVATAGSDAVVSLTPTGSATGATDVILTINGASGLSLSNFLAHSLT